MSNAVSAYSAINLAPERWSQFMSRSSLDSGLEILYEL